MQIDIKISRYGTKVALASELYRALRLPPWRYRAILRDWIQTEYDFGDGPPRRPELLRDYARRTTQDAQEPDFYLSLPLALQIAARAEGKGKRRVENHLRAADQALQLSLF